VNEALEIDKFFIYPHPPGLMSPAFFGKRATRSKGRPGIPEDKAELQEALEGHYSLDEVRNFLDEVPVITAEWVEKEGVIGIINHRFKTDRGRRMGAFFGLNPHFYMRIRKENRYGQFIWRNIDGKRTIREIGTAMFAKFSEDETLSYQRVKLFMDTLRRNNYVRYLTPDEKAGGSEGAEDENHGETATPPGREVDDGDEENTES